MNLFYVDIPFSNGYIEAQCIVFPLLLPDNIENDSSIFYLFLTI